MTMPDGFKVTCDECAVTIRYSDTRSGFAIDITPSAARRLAAELIDKAELCEDSEEYELEQMA
jgi:hypothetical protein